MKASWGALGSFLGRLGDSGGALGAPWGALGRRGVLLGALEALLGGSRKGPERVLERKSLLGPSWSRLGNGLGAVLEAPREGLGALLEPLGPRGRVFAQCST